MAFSPCVAKLPHLANIVCHLVDLPTFTRQFMSSKVHVKLPSVCPVPYSQTKSVAQFTGVTNFVPDL